MPPVQGPTALTLDLVNVVRRMKLLGFNGVRLPFSFTDLYTRTPVDRTLVSAQLGIMLTVYALQSYPTHCPVTSPWQ